MKTLTVTEAAKKLSHCLKRVYFEHESYQLVKNGVPYARLVPANGTICNTHELADDLESAQLSADDRRAMGSAVRTERKIFKRLRNPWA